MMSNKKAPDLEDQRDIFIKRIYEQSLIGLETCHKFLIIDKISFLALFGIVLNHERPVILER